MGSLPRMMYAKRVSTSQRTTATHETRHALQGVGTRSRVDNVTIRVQLAKKGDRAMPTAARHVGAELIFITSPTQLDTASAVTHGSAEPTPACCDATRVAPSAPLASWHRASTATLTTSSTRQHRRAALVRTAAPTLMDSPVVVVVVGRGLYPTVRVSHQSGSMGTSVMTVQRTAGTASSNRPATLLRVYVIYARRGITSRRIRTSAWGTAPLGSS